MKKLTLITLFTLFVLAGSASASTADILQPAQTIIYNEELVVNSTARFDSIYVGKQDEGGVTFFNGTIINSTTTSSGGDIAVTFGDNVRIDGEIFRTEVGGDNPIKLADTLRPQTTATYNLGTTSNKFKNAYFSGTVTAANLSALNIYTKSEINTMLSSKSNTTHNHNSSYYTESEIDSTFVSQSNPSWNSQSGRISIPGAAFVPEDSIALSRVSINAAAVLSLSGGPGSSYDFYAPLQLPEGSIITEVILNFWDNTGDAENITATLRGVSDYGASLTNLSDDLVSTNEGAIVGDVSDTSINNATIYNTGFAYFIRATFSDGNQGGNLRLVSAEVVYDFTDPY